MAGSGADDDIFRLATPQKGPVRRKLFALVRRPLEKLLCLGRLNDVYSRVAEFGDEDSFWQRVLDALNITCELSEHDQARIPRKGPLIVVANHPFGGLEGIILMSLVRSVRSDVKVMANSILGLVPETRADSIFVDPFGKKSSLRTNVGALKEAIAWVEQGGALCVFPSGEVSHISWRKPVVTDPKWSETIGRIIRHTEAPVLPVFFKGMNSALFQVLGLVHPRLRTVMLPRETLRKSDKTVTVRIGRRIPASRLAAIESDKDMMDYLRLKTYVLGRRKDGKDEESPAAAPRPPDHDHVPIVEQEDEALIRAEVDGLPRDAVVVETREFAAYGVEAEAIPHVLREIGRLREIAFRDVGEGTGRELDLDRFDDYYLHLFLWNKEKEEVVGAYRLGRTDSILQKRGKRGLYTSTLFRMSRKLLRQINPALELGRSFVRPEYQKHHAPLLLLWKGIAGYILRNPRYRILFGPVSISNDYNSTSRRLIVQFLRQNEYLGELARMVKPRSPMRRRRVHGLPRKGLRTATASIEELSSLIADIEADEKGVPILLKHYLRLEGKLLGFNLDPSFGDVVDGLILVDLTETDEHVLERYMGKEGLARFLAYYRKPEQGPDRHAS